MVILYARINDKPMRRTHLLRGSVRRTSMKHRRPPTPADPDSPTLLSRRALLEASSGLFTLAAPWLFGCQRGSSGSAPATSEKAPRLVLPNSSSRPSTGGTPAVCALTHDNIEGPYYRAGAPERADLTDPAFPGVLLDIEGRVFATDCSSGLSGVELDVWQANANGHYDNDGTMNLGGKLLLRGRVRTDGDGRYRLRTIVPGRYLNGAQYRPAHVHVKLRGKALAPLTTQLYFPDDPYNKIDPFIHPSLVMDVKKGPSALLARFDFVLRPS